MGLYYCYSPVLCKRGYPGELSADYFFPLLNKLKHRNIKPNDSAEKNYTEQGECKYLEPLISEGSLQEGQGGGRAVFKDNGMILTLFEVITD